MMKYVFILSVLIYMGCARSSNPVLQETTASGSENISATHSLIQYSGRIDFSDPERPVFSYPGISIKAKFEGTSLSVLMKDISNGNQANYFAVIIDEKLHSVLKLNKADSIYPIAANLSEGTHTVVLFKRTESLVGKVAFLGFLLDKDKKLLELPAKPSRKIEFIGNSITCGYGNEGKDQSQPFADSTENNYMAFGAITARNLNAQYMAVCYSGKGVYRNYGDSPEETLPALYDRIFPTESSPKWDVKNYIPDAVVLNLGTNDFYGPGTDSASFVAAYKTFVERIRNNYPEAKIFCVIGPMMSDSHPKGENALSRIRSYLSSMVKTFNEKGEKDVFFFELTQQGKFGMGSDFHPNIAQHKYNAEELTNFIKEKMSW